MNQAGASFDASEYPTRSECIPALYPILVGYLQRVFHPFSVKLKTALDGIKITYIYRGRGQTYIHQQVDSYTLPREGKMLRIPSTPLLP